MKVSLLAVPFILSDFHLNQASKTIESVKTNHEIKLYAFVNAYRAESRDHDWIIKSFDYVTFNDINCVARAWNRGIRQCLADGAERVLVTNLDIEFHPAAIDRLIACSQRNPESLIWSPSRWLTARTFLDAELSINDCLGTNWSCYMVDHRLFNIVGEFDEQFAPAYREDSDMMHRINLAGFNQGIVACDSLILHGELGTMKGCLEIKDLPVRDRVTLAKAMRKIVGENDQRYIKKWGGLPGSKV